MKTLLKSSFEQNPQALQKLLATGSAELTHTQDKSKWSKEFPKLLMEVRQELNPNKSTNNAKFVGGYGTAGGTANYYHEKFSKLLGVNSIEEIQQAIDKGAEVTYETETSNKAMFIRNAKVAEESNAMIAYTYGEGNEPADGGTKDTWSKVKYSDKVHVPIHKITIQKEVKSIEQPIQKEIKEDIEITKANYTKLTPNDKSKGFFFTENLQAYLANRGRGAEVRFDLAPKDVKLDVTATNNQAGIRRNNGVRNLNAFAIISKKFQQNGFGNFVKEEGQFKDTNEDFELFKKYNTEAIDEAIAYNKPLVIAEAGIATGKSALPLRFAEWLNNELKTKLGIQGTIRENTSTGYKGYGIFNLTQEQPIVEDKNERNLKDQLLSQAFNKAINEFLPELDYYYLDLPKGLTEDQEDDISSKLFDNKIPNKEYEKKYVRRILTNEDLEKAKIAEKNYDWSIYNNDGDSSIKSLLKEIDKKASTLYLDNTELEGLGLERLLDDYIKDKIDAEFIQTAENKLKEYGLFKLVGYNPNQLSMFEENQPHNPLDDENCLKTK